MLASLLRITIFLALLALISLGAVWLADNGGTVRLIIADTEFNPGPVQLVVLIAVTLVAVWLAFRLLGLVFATIRFLTGDETAITRYFNRNRERRGFEALSDSLIALASGDARGAYKSSARAEKLLHRPELTDLITAQAAERIGENGRATEAWKRLLGHEKTRFAAVRGLIGQKLKSGESEQALKLTEKALAMQPANAEVQDTLLRLQAEKGDWAGARSTLKVKYNAGLLPKDLWRRRDAVLMLGEAQGSSGPAAEDLALAANKLAPDLTEGAVQAARAWVARGRPKDAAKALKRAYDVQPHPDLVTAYALLVPDETPEARLKRMGALFAGKGDHPESRMALSELQMATGDFPEARRTLLPLTESETEARAMTLMAALERALGADDALVRGWLARAITAPRGMQWVCQRCDTVSAAWHPACPHCHAIDTLAWSRAKGDPQSLPGANLTLPLLTGGVTES